MKIDFEFNTEYGLFRDALYLEDNHAFTEEDLQAMKQERVDNWILAITTPASNEVVADQINTLE